MAKDPAFLFYPSDFLTGTMFFTDEDIGIYIKLLCAQHQQNGSINKKVFDSMVKEDSLIREKFIEDSEGYYNQRMLDEMIKRKKKSDNLSANALKRWSNEKLKKCKSNAIASNLNMPTKDEDENKDEDIINNKIDFEIFWNAYDKKRDKPKCKTKWDKLPLETQQKIIDYIPNYKLSQPDKQYRKDPMTFLNNESWENEIIKPCNNGNGQQIMTQKEKKFNVIG